MGHAQPIGQNRGIPLEIVSRVVSRNGVPKSTARSNNVIDIRHLQSTEFVGISRSTGANSSPIGESLGVSARTACRQYGGPTSYDPEKEPADPVGDGHHRRDFVIMSGHERGNPKSSERVISSGPLPYGRSNTFSTDCFCF